jgi:hypothetical protein
MKLAPKTAVLVRDGKEEEVGIDEVQTGDLFAVRPGENIPVDGVNVEGTTAVNESALTGESIPMDKEEGDSVSAATVNQSGYILCRATRVGEDTTLSQIIQMVSDAAATKAPIARIADQVSAAGRMHHIEVGKTAGVKQREALVMTGGQGDVLTARVFRGQNQLLRVEILSGEGVLQLFIFLHVHSVDMIGPFAAPQLGIKTPVHEHTESKLFKRRNIRLRYRNCHNTIVSFYKIDIDFEMGIKIRRICFPLPLHYTGKVKALSRKNQHF